MGGYSCFAEAPLGLLDHGPGELRDRHCHDDAFVAVVLEGGYQEAGDEGRWNVRPGDALVHHAFESHLDRFEAKGARVLVLALPPELATTRTMRGYVADPDRLVRLAERDARAASAYFAEMFVTAGTTALDWPDLLADDLRRLAPFALAHWAEEKGVRAETLSRGFRSAYGCTPKSYRADVRARAALTAARHGREPFAHIAHRLHFADQAHMTHAVARLTGATPGWWRRRQMDTRQR
ncbi:transcriptional regulator, AraC family [Sphingopyxis sp. YR583]|uniref:helix-turn-helix transcriptional regulator n=1 Tax=Sphingopyxis sp. YR583 TaxID=1881047 RepID=UPI0008A7C174|nr:helix-turn-helix domain-containing protein [Sphingopyxis sp. YR583]SEH18681.1 transcriptional regulator, AraC family [Sphingopyxis sp. YR583]